MRWLRPVDGLRVRVGLIVVVHLVVVGLTIALISSKQNQPDAEDCRCGGVTIIIQVRKP